MFFSSFPKSKKTHIAPDTVVKSESYQKCCRSFGQGIQDEFSFQNDAEKLQDKQELRWTEMGMLRSKKFGDNVCSK